MAGRDDERSAPVASLCERRVRQPPTNGGHRPPLQNSAALWRERIGRNRVAVGGFGDRLPKVAALRQPWALCRSPVGLTRSATLQVRGGFTNAERHWRLHCVTTCGRAAGHRPRSGNPKGIVASSPRLRGTSYLGSRFGRRSNRNAVAAIFLRQRFNPTHISRPIRSRACATRRATRPENSSCDDAPPARRCIASPCSASRVGLSRRSGRRSLVEKARWM